ncbi:MAG: PASTA domain-containing protein [Abditibacteriaceae bacterium]
MLTHGSKSSPKAHSPAAQRYEVLERHGEGVLFVVYRVRERATMDVFALKALRHTYARHQPFCVAWQQVAQAALHRHLPHIAEVYEVGVEENTPYLVEEWLPGHTLEERLRRAPFGRIETSSLARRMAKGLAGLHDAGQVHGDFRPHQVLFNSASELKITDVGWDQAIRGGGLSLVDVFPDSAYYLSPETWSGKSASPASDMYALGVVLYRMLAGRLPFDGASPVAIAEQHQKSYPAPPSQFNHASASELQEITLGLLHKSPDQRIAPFERLLNLHTEPTTYTPKLVPPVVESVPQETFPETPAKAPKPKRILTRRELGKKELKSALLAFLWALIAIGLLAAIIIGAINFWMQGAPPEVRVPNYVGMNQTDAATILKQKGLTMEVGREVYNPKRPSGTVLSGQPRPDTIVRSGRQVLVTVSRGREPIQMYDFRDLTLDQTKRIMQKHGLRLGQISNQYDNTIPKGSIIAQSPTPGQYFHRYDPISFVVSSGPMPSGSSSQADENSSANTDNSRIPTDTSTDSNVNTQTDDNTSNSADNSTGALTSEDVKVNIQMPPNSAPQLVTIVVDDATGEHTIYSEMKQPGDIINQTVHIAKNDSSQATVQVYAGGQLLREMQF